MDFNVAKIKLIIGLGNPEKEYADTYHNVGHLIIDCINSYSLLTTHYSLIKSNVYMNESGGFVKTALRKYKTEPEELLIIQDDSDIEIGKYKLSFNRGSAGHKGIESIIKSLKTKDFWRLRIGIAKPPTAGKKIKAESFVLKKISKTNEKILNKVFQEIKEIML